jgi:hypothetical protein
MRFLQEVDTSLCFNWSLIDSFCASNNLSEIVLSSLMAYVTSVTAFNAILMIAIFPIDSHAVAV